MSTNGTSMASKVMDKAVELAIEEKSPFPARSFFVDADTADTGREIFLAADEGYAVVLVDKDGSSLVIEPGRRIESQQPAASPKAA